MSQTKTARPTPPTLSQAARLRPRYLAGARLGDLSAELGCWRNDLRRMFETLGCLRAEDRLPRLCRVCQEPVRSSSRRDLCSAHVRQFCSRCEVALPKGRANRWCSDCERERKPDDYRYRRLLALKSPGQCCDCPCPLQPGRINSRCTACASQYRRLQRERARRRRCAGCRILIPARCQTYCDNCAAMLSQWRYAYHHGDPAARAIRPLKEYQRWQQDAP